MDCTPYNIKAPALPLAPLEYDQKQQDQFQYALRLYFNRLDNYLAELSACINMSGTITDPTYVTFPPTNVDAFNRLVVATISLTPARLLVGLLPIFLTNQAFN
jgi:hypothetical protein